MLNMANKDGSKRRATSIHRYTELDDQNDEENCSKQSEPSTGRAENHSAKGPKEITNNFGGKPQAKQQMKPLFLFLASSLNTEIVYVILKSITQFSYICCDD